MSALLFPTFSSRLRNTPARDLVSVSLIAKFGPRLKKLGEPWLRLVFKTCQRLKMNQCLCMPLFQKREWLLLAKGEPPSRGHSLKEPASAFYVIVPSRSPTLLVKAVATRELMLPSPFPLLPEEPPDDSLKIVEAGAAQISWDR